MLGLLLFSSFLNMHFRTIRKVTSLALRVWPSVILFCAYQLYGMCWTFFSPNGDDVCKTTCLVNFCLTGCSLMPCLNFYLARDLADPHLDNEKEINKLKNVVLAHQQHADTLEIEIERLNEELRKKPQPH